MVIKEQVDIYIGHGDKRMVDIDIDKMLTIENAVDSG